MNVQPFSPNTTTKIAAIATSQNVVIDPNVTTSVVRVVVTGGNAYIRFTSNAADVATLADMPVIVGPSEVFSKGNASRMVVIADTTATVFVTTGEGQ